MVVYDFGWTDLGETSDIVTVVVVLSLTLYRILVCARWFRISCEVVISKVTVAKRTASGTDGYS